MTERYTQPSGDDEPLDDVEWAIVRALAAIFVKQIREEFAAEQRVRGAATSEPPATTREMEHREG